jgi:hypothetical protein
MLLAATNAEWVGILTTWYQDSARAEGIEPDSLKTPSDAALGHAIAYARGLGLSVMLKPHVDCQNGDWRGAIVPDTAGEWFRSYQGFICRYARLAESLDCEQLCIGTELEGTTEGYDSAWRVIIDSVRSRFSGAITYAANWDGYRARVPFWDAVDLVGIDAYFPLTGIANPSVEELVAAWNSRWLPTLDSFQARVGKPILLTEIGYRSVDSANIRPWDYGMTGPVDTAEQRDCYEAAFRVFWSKPWFHGFFWWNWTTFPGQGGPDDSDYTPHGKPAERVLRQWYRSAIQERRGEASPQRPARPFPNPFRAGTRPVGPRLGGKEWRLYEATGAAAASPSLPAGVYFLRLGTGSGPAVQVVIVR